MPAGRTPKRKEASETEADSDSSFGLEDEEAAAPKAKRRIPTRGTRAAGRGQQTLAGALYRCCGWLAALVQHAGDLHRSCEACHTHTLRAPLPHPGIRSCMPMVSSCGHHVLSWSYVLPDPCLRHLRHQFRPLVLGLLTAARLLFHLQQLSIVRQCYLQQHSMTPH